MMQRGFARAHGAFAHHDAEKSMRMSHSFRWLVSGRGERLLAHDHAQQIADCDQAIDLGKLEPKVEAALDLDHHGHEIHLIPTGQVVKSCVRREFDRVVAQEFSDDGGDFV
jgi:hypothetical protein